MKIKMRLIIASVITIVLLSAGCDLNGSNASDDNGNDSNDTVTYNLRDRGPAGGWVFYDKGSYSDGWWYMEAWIADEGEYQWRITGSSGTESTLTDIGTGYNNTYTHLSPESSYPAAKAAKDATHGGKNDWFLPSKDELDKMWVNLWSDGPDDNGVTGYTKVGSFASEYYWSSSHVNSDYAWKQSFSSGNQWKKDPKTDSELVRVVRAF